MIQIDLGSGKYVIAVSGGVDSMVLLDVLRRRPGLSLLVAHVDHGIRADSAADAQLAVAAAQQYGLPFFSTRLQLGVDASEAVARKARYRFLEAVRLEQGAVAIVTAHHEDDAIETAILNLARGTGRRGLTALASSPGLRRPLLSISKTEILAYAAEHDIAWREDSTNADDGHLRNYIRHHIVPRFSDRQRAQLLHVITSLRPLNTELDRELAAAVAELTIGNTIDRQALQVLPSVVCKELLTAWWRQNDFRDYQTKTVVRAFQALQRGRTGTVVPLKKPFFMTVGRGELALHNHER